MRVCGTGDKACYFRTRLSISIVNAVYFAIGHGQTVIELLPLIRNMQFEEEEEKKRIFVHSEHSHCSCSPVFSMSSHRIVSGYLCTVASLYFYNKPNTIRKGETA